ncbi:MAG: cupin domain-containing protein [Deltaproteobacteria bacterium]|nr:cupin domain-containing protein [Deltaproteobacteria bacterium]
MKTVDERTGEKVEKTVFSINTSEDFARLRQLWSKLPMIPKVTRVEDAPSVFRLPGSTIKVLMSGEESGGSVSVFYQEVEPGSGAPPHHQPNEEEHFFILEGEMEMTVGNQTITAKPGTFVFAPRNATHAFKNRGTSVCKFLTWNSPAGHERMFEAGQRMGEQGVKDLELRRRTLTAHDTIFHDR